MSLCIQSPDVPFGICKVLPMVGFPEGKVRIKMRPGKFVEVYIRNSAGVTCYIPQTINGHWVPCVVRGQNLTP